MKTQIVNLTLPLITREIEQVLETYPDHPYQQAFANPELRQRLIAFVMSQADCKYGVMDQEHPMQIEPEISLASVEDKVYLEQCIHHGIRQLLIQQAEWIEQRIPQSSKSDREPSHWFG